MSGTPPEGPEIAHCTRHEFFDADCGWCVTARDDLRRATRTYATRTYAPRSPDVDVALGKYLLDVEGEGPGEGLREALDEVVAILDRTQYVADWPEDERELHRRGGWRSFDERHQAVQRLRAEKIADLLRLPLLTAERERADALQRQVDAAHTAAVQVERRLFAATQDAASDVMRGALVEEALRLSRQVVEATRKHKVRAALSRTTTEGGDRD